jgi:hypothetical protein
LFHFNRTLGKFGDMLPRLRFIIAATVIALLPMVIFSASPFIGSQGSPDGVRPHAPLGTVDAREAQQLQVLAYGRRADELTRLREMASVPLAVWVASPVDGQATEPAAAQAPEPVPAQSPEQTAPAQPEPAPLTIAALPDPAEAAPPSAPPPIAMTNQEPMPAAEEPEPGINHSKVETAPAGPNVIAAIDDATPPVTTTAAIDRLPPQFMPPLPKPRPKAKPVKRARVAAARTPAPVDPVPFGGLFDAFTPAAQKPASR